MTKNAQSHKLKLVKHQNPCTPLLSCNFHTTSIHCTLKSFYPNLDPQGCQIIFSRILDSTFYFLELKMLFQAPYLNMHMDRCTDENDQYINPPFPCINSPKICVAMTRKMTRMGCIPPHVRISQDYIFSIL